MLALTWNCRGIDHPSTVRILKDYIKSYKPNVIFLSELKLSNLDKIHAVVKAVGFSNMKCVPARGQAGGLLLIWDSVVNIQVVLANDFVIDCMVIDESMDTPWQFTAVYGPPSPLSKPLFWDCLQLIGAAFDGHWLVMGDFNTILSSADKLGGRPVATSSNGGLKQVIDTHGLIDLGFIGSASTWTNRRASTANIQERLDKGFANANWQIHFPNATIYHLVALNSDHKPLLLDTNPRLQTTPQPFRFESMWTLHPNTGLIISKAWNRGHTLTSKLKNTKMALKDWNRRGFGHI